MKQSQNCLVVSFVSGKGGVGKTMLAAAFAKEMSLGNPTLIVDLDFFNRGLTGLFREGRVVATVSYPDFLEPAASNLSANDKKPWSVIEVAENLFSLSYPHLTQREMQLFEELSVGQLRDSLQRWIAEIRETCNAACVVLDCHGGPDNSSFAAALLSDRTYLVSEPDRITFFGTLNFLRTLGTVEGGESVDVRLIFNKVIPAFSPFFLFSFYEREIRRHFANKPLAAVIPQEPFLAKAFERTPFLTHVYPSSLLTRKVRLLLRDLFAELGPRALQEISPRLRLPRQASARMMFGRLLDRYSLGKPLFLLNADFVIGVIVFVVIVNLAWWLAWTTFGSKQLRPYLQALDRIVLIVYAASGSPITAIKDSPVDGSVVSPDSVKRCVFQRVSVDECIRTLVGRKSYFLVREGIYRQAAYESESKFLESVNPRYSYRFRDEAVQLHKAGIDFAKLYAGKTGDAVPKVTKLKADLRAKGLTGRFEEELATLTAPLGWTTGAAVALKLRLDRLHMDLVFLPLGAWFAATLFFSWSTALQRHLVFNLRRRVLSSAAGILLVLMLLWYIPLSAAGRVVDDALVRAQEFEWDDGGIAAASIIVLLALLGLLVRQLYRLALDFLVEKDMRTGVVNLALLFYGVSTVFFGSRMYLEEPSSVRTSLIAPARVSLAREDASAPIPPERLRAYSRRS